MKRLALLSLALALPLVGCPASQQQQAAQAVDNAAIALLAAQQVEQSAHANGLITSPEDAFINQQFQTLSTIGTTADSCIKGASSTGSAITCLNTAITAVDTINTSGGTYLKSANAKAYFAMGIAAVRDVLAGIDTAIGGTPEALPTTVTP